MAASVHDLYMAERKTVDRNLQQAIGKAIRAIRKSEELIQRTAALLEETEQILRDRQKVVKRVWRDPDFSGRASK
jgi:ferritin-like metal-binding protein YciE